MSNNTKLLAGLGALLAVGGGAMLYLQSEPAPEAPVEVIAPKKIVEAPKEEPKKEPKFKEETSEKVETKVIAHFDFDKKTIRKQEIVDLNKEIDSLKAEPAIKKIKVTGHTDSVGTDEYNQKLGQFRADAVKWYMEEMGLKDRTITAETAGEGSPVADNATAEGRAKNRRAEMETRKEIVTKVEVKE